MERIPVTFGGGVAPWPSDYDHSLEDYIEFCRVIAHPEQSRVGFRALEFELGAEVPVDVSLAVDFVLV